MPIDRDLVAGMRYLVVEDQGFQRWVISHTLETLGAVKVLSASDGQAALEILETLDPPIDIVVTDLNMPAMDGIEFIRHLGKSRHAVGLIVASEQDPSLIASVVTMARAYGVRLLDAIAKPVTTKKLADALARLGSVAHPLERAPIPLPQLEEVLDAIDRDEIEPVFQAKLSTATGEVQGAEALARWRHPRHGVLMPASFISTLEAADQIDRLTMKMLSKSARACRSWQKAGFHIGVAVNISAISLSDLRLTERIMEAVVLEEVDPRHVTLEVTETATSGHQVNAIENLSRLRMKGFGLSLDDYGTGYASMQQLTQVPFTELKVDQCFVRAAPSSDSARAVLESSLEIARKLNVPAVAEGVESKTELNLLRELGCALAQGYYLARPMLADKLTDWMIEARTQQRAGKAGG